MKNVLDISMKKGEMPRQQIAKNNKVRKTKR
jgi:hypothetical protein